MTTLHTFGCSITQGFALPDVVQPLLDDQGDPISDDLAVKLLDSGQRKWEEVHLYKPSQYAWPKILGDRLGVTVENHARRGACFNQIARQCVVAVPQITAKDLVIVMWTYMSRISLQWPARTAVPFCNMVDPGWGWASRRLPGFNNFFGLSGSTAQTHSQDSLTHKFIESYARLHLDPHSVYDQYYKSLVLLSTVDGLLRSTGARVLHLSVEVDTYLDQLAQAKAQLDPSLSAAYTIPDPQSWYTVDVDHDLCMVIHDPSIPPAENDMHPSVTHHRLFADHVYRRYFA